MADDFPAQSGSDADGRSGEWSARGRVARDALAETWAGLAAVTADLDEAGWARPTACPGWDVKDQVSHVIGIERSLLGEAPPVWDAPLGDHVKNDFAAALEPWVAVRRSRSGAEVRDELLAVTTDRLARLDALGEEDWARVGFSPAGEVPYAVFMEVRVFDCWVHEQDVRQALGRPGGEGGGASSISVERVQGSMGYVVGKKAKCPDGKAVRFALQGPGGDGRAVTVRVEDGRARVVDGGPDAAPPDVTISLSSLDFVRLGCGRVSREEVEAAGGIGVEGDAALATSVLDAMNFMF